MFLLFGFSGGISVAAEMRSFINLWSGQPCGERKQPGSLAFTNPGQLWTNSHYILGLPLHNALVRFCLGFEIHEDKERYRSLQSTGTKGSREYAAPGLRESSRKRGIEARHLDDFDII